jgi:two-component system, OmpR family, KDP operon response regulator KdpE
MNWPGIPVLQGHRLYDDHPPRVLLIEDEAGIAAHLLDLLAQRGCQVTALVSGGEGVIAAASSHPDLLVLNIKLPDMTGAQVVQQIRALDGLALLPVVFVSSERYDATHPDASAGVVLKPFLMRDLGEALDFGLRPLIGPPVTFVLPAA